MKKVLGVVSSIVFTFAILFASFSDPDPPPKVMAKVDTDNVNTYYDPDPPPKIRG